MNTILLSGLLTLAAPAADDSLRAAIQRGDVEKVKAYVEANADLDRLTVLPPPDSDPRNPAVFKFRTEGELMMLHHQADHQAHVELPLTLAITLGKKEIARVLLEGGADPGRTMSNGRTAVHCAVRSHDPETLALLIKRKAPLDTQDRQGVTPLMMAVCQGDLGPVKALLAAGANPDRADQAGSTALHLAIQIKKPELLDLLLEHKADPNRADKDGRTPLHLAINTQHRDMAERLLAAGAKADVADAGGESALASALSRGEYDLAQLLLDAGARVDRRDEKGRTPLHQLVVYPGAERFLLARKADVNARGADGRTALHHAVEGCQNWNWDKASESVVTLLRHGADPSLKDDKGRTPFDLAVEIRSYRACRILTLHDPKRPEVDPLKLWDENSSERKHYLDVKKGLDEVAFKADTVNEFGVPLLTAAVASGEDALVELLLARKADPNRAGKDQPTPLYQAAVSNSWLSAKLLLDGGAKLTDEKGVFGATLLYVVEKGNVELARLLLDNGADVNVTWSHRTDEHMTPLLLAVKQGDVSMVDLLLERKASVNVRGWWADTPLACVAYMNGRRMILDKVLAVKGLDLNLGNHSGVTLLHLAAEKGDVKLMGRLLDLGADPNALERQEYSPLHWAVWNNQFEAAKLLIRRGARPSYRVNRNGVEYGVTMLHAAAAAKWPQSPEIVGLILEQGVDVNSRDAYGKTPLHYAAECFGNPEIVRLLLKSGADVNAREGPRKDGATPLYHACAKGYEAAVKQLLDAGADPKLTSAEGYTPLYVACCAGSAPVVELLLERGADPNVAAPGYLETPLHRAVKEGKAEIVGLLLKHKADAAARDDQGKTPLDYAGQRNTTEILDLFRR